MSFNKYKVQLALFILADCLITGCIEKESQPPGILICIADDVSFPYLGNGEWVNTPAFDRIALEGPLL